MPFNSRSYHRNRYRREALENLAKARDIKARAARGEAYDWELPRIRHFVDLARIDWRMYRIMKGNENVS